MFPRGSYNFPLQRVSGAEKQKADWYANCIDYVIDAGLGYSDRTEVSQLLDILHGNIPNEFYKKTLNPYNSNKERYTRFPATMRNLDIMSDIVRRYVSEYFKGVHEFAVSADSADIIMMKEQKLRNEVMNLAQQMFMQQFQQKLQELQQQGQDVSNITPDQIMPDIEQFVADFNTKYIDDKSKQGQMILDFIRDNTQDNFIYLGAFFDFCALGECYSYTDVYDNKIIKEHVPVVEAYPIPNSSYFVEDHDMFARKMLLSYQQIIDKFDDYLDDKDRHFLEQYYLYHTTNNGPTQLLYSQYFETYPSVCEKFTNTERELFKHEPVTIASENNQLYEVWHVVWRGEAKRGILKRINEVGFIEEIVVNENYEFNPETDLDIEWKYEPQVYEGYRIGTRTTAVYPIKARPIAYNRNGKLPYNGIMEVLPNMGKFSIIKTITPFQVLRNIISYHREMVIAKNKLLILLMPESLIASDTEDKIYKMAADGVLLYDDSEDSNSLKAQQIRMLNASLGDYIAQLTQLMESIKYEARELVDMNQQRYGEIAQSAGQGTTNEAIARSSMGSVIITAMFDEFRCHDYNRDLDYGKFAYIDGLQSHYKDSDGKDRYISIDVNAYLSSQLTTTVKNDAKELDKIRELKQWAFSAAQNGDLDMAIAAITGNNVSTIKATVEQYMNIKRQHEEQLKQADQMLEQAKLESKLKEIAAKGEQDRLTEQLKYQYELQLKYVDVDVSAMGQQPDLVGQERNRLTADAERNRSIFENEKLNLKKQQLISDTYNKAADREIKREDIKAKVEIAKTNKNKYDK